MDVILWDGENTFPAKIESFKQFLKKYLTSLHCEDLLSDTPFHYDAENDEFLNQAIQAYYYLWSIS